MFGINKMLLMCMVKQLSFKELVFKKWKWEVVEFLKGVIYVYILYLF